MADQPNETELERRLRERAAAEESNTVDIEAEPAESDATAADPQADEIAVLKDQVLRARAEFDNFRKRTAREVERIRKTAAESLIHELLSVVDNLELALQHGDSDKNALAEGVKLVHKQILDVLERNGLERIEAVGKRFDPNIHEAVAQSASDEVEADHVINEFQRGYRLGGQILRPSKVLVSRGPADPSQS